MFEKSLAEDFAMAIISYHKWRVEFPVFITNMKNVIDALMFDKTITPDQASAFSKYCLKHIGAGFNITDEVINNLSSNILKLDAELEMPFNTSVVGPIIQSVNIKRGCSVTSNGYSYVIRKMANPKLKVVPAMKHSKNSLEAPHWVVLLEGE
jgi:hypothetical protein